MDCLLFVTLIYEALFSNFSSYSCIKIVQGLGKYCEPPTCLTDGGRLSRWCFRVALSQKRSQEVMMKNRFLSNVLEEL